MAVQLVDKVSHKYIALAGLGRWVVYDLLFNLKQRLSKINTPLSKTPNPPKHFLIHKGKSNPSYHHLETNSSVHRFCTITSMPEVHKILYCLLLRLQLRLLNRSEGAATFSHGSLIQAHV